MRYLLPILAAASFAAAPLSAHALSATQTVQKEITRITADGTTQIVREEAAKVVPGERVVYTLNYENDDAQPATDIVLTMPIPSEVAFIEGTADKSGAVVTYSADGGETFSSRQSVMMMDAGGNIRAAGAADLTHVRWTVAGPVAVGTADNLSFSATIK